MPSNRRKPSQKQRKASTQHSGSYRGRQKALRIPVGRQIDTEIAIAMVGLLVKKTHPSRLQVQLDRLCQRVAEQFELDETDEKARLAIAARIDRHHEAAVNGARSARPPEPMDANEQHEEADRVGVDSSKPDTLEIGV